MVGLKSNSAMKKETNEKLETLTVTIDANEEDMIEAVEEVLRLLKQGFTSGYEPQWNLVTE